MPHNFSYIIPGQLAGAGLPGAYGRYLESDLASLRQEGIGALVTLVREPLAEAAVRAAGLEWLHLPIDDFGIPTDEQIDRFVTFVRAQVAAGRAVAAHCGAGLGRTGTMLACYLVFIGESADDAIESVRRIRPGSIETAEQEECVRAYARRLRKRRKGEEGHGRDG